MESGWSVDNYKQCKEKNQNSSCGRTSKTQDFETLSGEEVKCEAGLRSKELGHSWLTKWLESQKPSLPEQPDEHPQPRQENGRFVLWEGGTMTVRVLGTVGMVVGRVRYRVESGD